MLLVLAALPVVLGQGATYRPACVEVLRLTAAEFTDLFVKRSGDSSELGYDAGVLYWANCKRQSNLKRLEATPLIAPRILKLRDSEAALLTADAEIASLRAGGGPVFARARTRAQAALEAHVGRVIALSTARSGSITSPAIRKRFAVAMMRVESRIKRLQVPVAGDLKRSARSAFAEPVADYLVAYRGIRAFVTGQVNVMGLEVIEFAARGLFLE